MSLCSKIKHVDELFLMSCTKSDNARLGFTPVFAIFWLYDQYMSLLRSFLKEDNLQL